MISMTMILVDNTLPNELSVYSDQKVHETDDTFTYRNKSIQANDWIISNFGKMIMHRFSEHIIYEDLGADEFEKLETTEELVDFIIDWGKNGWYMNDMLNDCIGQDSSFVVVDRLANVHKIYFYKESVEGEVQVYYDCYGLEKDEYVVFAEGSDYIDYFSEWIECGDIDKAFEVASEVATCISPEYDSYTFINGGR